MSTDDTMSTGGAAPNGENGARMMDPNAAPVVEQPDLPLMGAQTVAATPGALMAAPPSGDVMGDAPGGGGTGGGGTGGDVMPQPAPVPGAGGPSAAEEFGEMEPAPPAPSLAASGAGEGYLRLVIDVDDGELTVVDAAVLDGPLVQTDLTGQMAYDAVVHGRRVAADAFDDLSARHSFAPPDHPEAGHLVGATSHFQFVVRIPRTEVSTADLADLEVTLMRPTDTTSLAPPAAATPTRSLIAAAAEAGVPEPAVVGRLSGVDVDALPDEVARAVRDGLG